MYTDPPFPYDLLRTVVNKKHATVMARRRWRRRWLWMS
jgi:hypothetical protein